VSRKGKEEMKPTHKLALLIVAYSLVALISLAVPSALFAQGCAQCYQSAAASGPRTIQALRNGIFILIVPPFFICVAITLMAYRRRGADSENS
jgi:hypothetical protein